jgi:hypothetical protein
VRIQICGELAIERNGQRLEAGLPGRQGRLLFTYMVVNRHRHVPRDELAEALWREPDPAAVDARLNPLLSKLRRVFGADSVDGRSTIRLCLPVAWEPPPRPYTGPNPQLPSRTGRELGGQRSPHCSWPSATSSPAKTPPGSMRSATS